MESLAGCVISRVDPRGPDALELIRELSRELANLYDHSHDGSGDFRPEDALVAKSAFLVARLGDRALGCGAIRPLEEGVAEVKRMYVRPEFRGLGLAKAILAELERLAVEFGYSCVRLETGPKQLRACAVYQRAGYRTIPRYGKYVGCEDSRCFEKIVSSPPPPLANR